VVFQLKLNREDDPQLDSREGIQMLIPSDKMMSGDKGLSRLIDAGFGECPVDQLTV
jgi:hypothetical protein